jgi:hypothetical protein
MPTAAIIEITGSHEECLYAQLEYCKAGGYRTLLVCSEVLREKVAEFGGDEQAFFDLTGNEEARAERRELLRLKNYLLEQKVDILVVNTAHGSMIRRFLWMMSGSGIRMYGVLHGINKLKGSLKQMLIGRRLRGYFLLNDYLLDNLTPARRNAKRFEVLYPIFFPAFRNPPALDKPPGQTWVVIPGQVEFKRRDYLTLIHAWAAISERPDIRFILLGSWDHPQGDGPRLITEMERLGIRGDFVFTGYMDNAHYHTYIQAADVVMPLIHKGKENFVTYFRDQITGAFSMAFAYHKPLLMAEEFRKYEDFRENAVFYTVDSLPKVLLHLAQLLNEQHSAIYQLPKWSFDYQAGKYLRFIEK